MTMAGPRPYGGTSNESDPRRPATVSESEEYREDTAAVLLSEERVLWLLLTQHSDTVTQSVTEAAQQTALSFPAAAAATLSALQSVSLQLSALCQQQTAADEEHRCGTVRSKSV